MSPADSQSNSVDLKPERKHTKLLGSPYSECADNNESSHCSRNLAEETIRNRCGCRYGLIHADAGTEVSNNRISRHFQSEFFRQDRAISPIE